MEDTLTSLKTAELAKQKGFDVPVVNFFANKKTPYVTTGVAYQSDRDDISNWNDGRGSYPTKAEDVLCSAPTLSLLQKWLREAKDVNIVPPLYYNHNGYACTFIANIDTVFFKTYDKALENELYKELEQLTDYIYEQ